MYKTFFILFFHSNLSYLYKKLSGMEIEKNSSLKKVLSNKASSENFWNQVINEKSGNYSKDELNCKCQSANSSGKSQTNSNSKK